MEGIRLIGTTVCVVTAATAIFSMLIPDQKLNKVLQFAISLFFLTGLISPFFSQKLDFHIPIETSTTLSQGNMTSAVSKSVLALAQARLEASLSNKLFANGIEAKKIKVTLKTENTNNMNNERIGNISINHVMVYIDKADEKGTAEKVKNLLKAETGVTAEVFAIGSLAERIE